MAFLGTAKGVDLQFASGDISFSPSARLMCVAAGISPYSVVAKHLRGEAGDRGTEVNVVTNESGTTIRKISNTYRLPTGEHVQVVTSNEHRTTTCLALLTS